MSDISGEDHKSNRLYKDLLNYAHGLDVDAKTFSGSLAQFLRGRFWEGWCDEAFSKRRSAISVEKFFSDPCTEGIGKSLPWVCGALETAKNLWHKSAAEALALLEAALSEAGEPGPKGAGQARDRAED